MFSGPIVFRSIGGVLEVFSDPDIHIWYGKTTEQIADMMTKGFSNKEVWDTLVSMSGLVVSKDSVPSGVVSQPSSKPVLLCVQIPTAFQ